MWFSILGIFESIERMNMDPKSAKLIAALFHGAEDLYLKQQNTWIIWLKLQKAISLDPEAASK